MENTEFLPLETKSIIIATNYVFLNPGDYIQDVYAKKLLEKLSLKPCDIKVKGQNPPTEEDLQQLASFMPVICKDTENDIEIQYIDTEKKLMVRQPSFNCDTFDKLKDISYNFIDMRLSMINAIGVNYTSSFNLGDIKLNLINNNILDEIPDFKHNLNFEFVLPIKYSDRNLIATYRIKKQSGGDETNEPRIYNINVNFHFDITSLTTKEKYEKLETILNLNLYNEYIEKCQGFLKLNDRRN